MSETQTCKHCGLSFTVTDQDIQFYQKISPVFAGKKYLIPPPTLCPDCRQQRRLTQRNERNFYKRICDKTGKDMVSIYSPDKPCTVYDQKVRRGTDWDPSACRQTMDFQKSFFEQYQELSLKAPRPSLINMSSENAEYTNHSAYNKDCYMCINTGYSQNCMYCTNYCIYDTGCMDCLNIHYCESCYYCTDVKTSQECGYLYNCEQCFKCLFCEDCRECNNCFLCCNLRHKSFCILNKQYAQEERYVLANKIFAQMEKDGTLGTFFPGWMNPFYFNDTAAYLLDDTFTKEEVRKGDYLRRDEEIKVDIPAGAEIVLSCHPDSHVSGEGYNLAQGDSSSSAQNDNNLKSLDDFQGFNQEGEREINPEIIKRVIKDEQGNCYKIIPMELAFLQKHGLPLPEIHRLERIKLGFRFK